MTRIRHTGGPHLYPQSGKSSVGRVDLMLAHRAQLVPRSDFPPSLAGRSRFERIAPYRQFRQGKSSRVFCCGIASSVLLLLRNPTPPSSGRWLLLGVLREERENARHPLGDDTS